MITNREKRHQQKLVKRAEMKRRTKLAKRAEQFKSNFPTPTKSKPTFNNMQRSFEKTIADLREMNHQLTVRLAKFNQQVAA
jgi:hypothetical protein